MLRNKKTGEIADSNMNAGAFGIYTVHNKDKSWCYTRPEQINEEWEEYEPKEPLIKDKKTRKAVKAWAEINAIRQVAYIESLNRESCCLTGIEDDRGYCIEFIGWIPTLKDCGEYSIAELCGKEE